MTNYKVIFEDDFNRSDSNTVGNGWTEIGNTDNVMISSNNLRINDNPNAGASGCYQVIPNPEDINYLKFRFKKQNISGASSVLQLHSLVKNKSLFDGGVWYSGMSSGTYSVVEFYIDWDAGTYTRYVDGSFSADGSLSTGKADSRFANNSLGVRSHGTADNSDQYYDYFILGKTIKNQYSYSIFDSCVAYYDFSKNALDVIGENNGVVNGATLNTNHLGQTNIAYSFPNDSDKIVCSTTGMSNSAGSVCMWIKTNSFSTAGDRGYFDTNPGVVGALRCYVKSSSSTLLYIETGGTTAYGVTHGMNTSDWYFLTYCWSGTTTKLYINNVLKGTKTGNSTPTISTFVIGQMNSAGLNCLISNVSIFNKELSTDEIGQFYNLTKNKVIYPIVRGGRE